ncbi:MAG: esterase-like activity of phytase family protein [Devosiaceae bacterium]|nr:esterase-like activity of phytase family protein [Devosiaceae bacterium MH13]
MRPSAGAWLATGLLASSALAPAVWAQGAEPEPIVIETRELPVFDRYTADNRYGYLTYLGGIELESPNRRFESLSGLVATGDDTFLMVTDIGDWLAATLVSDETGMPVTLRDVVLAPLVDGNGEPMRTKRLADAEALTLVGNEVWVTSERNQPIRAYRLSDTGLTGAARLPFGTEAPLRERWNHGIEAMVHLTTGPLAGETIIFLEEPPRLASDPTAARLTADGEVVPFAIQRRDRFAITGAAALPSGDVVILERRFAWEDGIFMRLRLLPADEILAGAAQGRLLLDADGRTIIDNMEGLAITDHEDGPILTLISDDNGNFFQRTILLRFQLTEPLFGLEAPTQPPPVARPDL